jgi:COQ9
MLFYLQQFEWYTKRAALAAVYGSTQLYMIQDNSPEYSGTWTFLNGQLTFMKQAAECSNKVILVQWNECKVSTMKIFLDLIFQIFPNLHFVSFGLSLESDAYSKYSHVY